MEVTYLIGNGFDLGFEIDTDYCSFLNHYQEVVTNDEDIQEFKARIKKNRELNSDGKWADCEIAKGDDTQNYEDGTVFLKCWSDFFSELIAYLEKQCNRIDEAGYADYSNELKRSLLNLSSVLPPKDRDTIESHPKYFKKENVRFNFICFNYTECLDRCLAELGNSPLTDWASDGRHTAYIAKTVHPHGCLKEGNYIFGVNDASQIANQTLLEDENVAIDIIKHNGNSNCKSYQEDKAIEIVNHSNLIVIFGMSLGETDRQWWQQIGNWLYGDPEHLLVIQQHKDITSQSPVWEQAQSERDAKKRFFELTDLSEGEIAEVEDRVIVAFKPSIFQFAQFADKYVS